MKNKIVIANWKMNLLVNQGWDLWQQMAHVFQLERGQNLPDICICPSFLGVAKINENLKTNSISGNNIFLGAQDASRWNEGAFTGEVSAKMLKESGCSHVIVGHSERRTLLGEDDKTIKEKALRIKEQDMTIVLCIGESREQKDAGLTYSTLSAQIEGVLGEDLQWNEAKIIIAYEPIWSIGTGNIPSNQYIQDITEHITSYAKILINKDISVIYGGSVNEGNAPFLREIHNIDGLLVGGASLLREPFLNIVKSFQN